MGIFSEYLERGFNFQTLTEERKKQLRRISELRGQRDLLVYAADLTKHQAPISIDFSDLLPIRDQLTNLQNHTIDFILETPGGSGEIAEDIARLLREKHKEVAVFVPGSSKSAGTILAMSGDEIWMDAASALGPIDAQIFWQGKRFSADALLEGFEKIKETVQKEGLNAAYIPILQAISPGELQNAKNALLFAKKLVAEWLAKYKFKTWTHHSKNGLNVTEEEKQKRAEEIAETLCNHRKWLTHGRSIQIYDLLQMRLQVHDYSEKIELADAIKRYYTLLQMTFAAGIYKVFETTTSQIYRYWVSTTPKVEEDAQKQELVVVEVTCGACNQLFRVQANFQQGIPLQPECLPFPKENILACPHCKTKVNLADARREVEMSTKKRIIP